MPLSASGYATAAVLGFAHTVGEFGVVLMIGGNIPGKTRVLSLALYDHVEALEYPQAHWLAGGLLVFSLAVLVVVRWLRGSIQPWRERSLPYWQMSLAVALFGMAFSKRKTSAWEHLPAAAPVT